MIKLPVFVSVLLFSLSVRAGDIGWLTVRGPLEDRALTYAYGEPLANNNLMDLNGQMTWSTPFVGYKGGDTIRYDMMLSTGSEGKFDSFTYVQVSQSYLPTVPGRRAAGDTTPHDPRGMIC